MREDRRSRKAPSGLFAAVSFALSAVLMLAAAYLPGVADRYRDWCYRPAAALVGRAAGLFPFSLSEVLLLLLLWGLLAGIASCIRGKLRCRSLFLRILSACGALCLLYTLFCGINYRAEAFSSQAGLVPGKSSTAELEKLCRYTAEQVNLRAEALEEGRIPSLREQAGEGRKAMEALGEEFPMLGGRYPRPKYLMLSRLLSVQQITGIYSPLAVEACVNREIPGYNLPFTICHELSHLRGYMREDEANFIAFLAASRSEDPWFSYSGWLSGWVYAGNALASADREAFREIHGTLCERAKKDLAENNRFWEQYEGAPAETHEKLNDAYLKANGQTGGTKSYGRMVDLMLEYARQHPFAEL